MIRWAQHIGLDRGPGPNQNNNGQQRRQHDAEPAQHRTPKSSRPRVVSGIRFAVRVGRFHLFQGRISVACYEPSQWCRVSVWTGRVLEWFCPALDDPLGIACSGIQQRPAGCIGCHPVIPSALRLFELGRLRPFERHSEWLSRSNRTGHYRQRNPTHPAAEKHPRHFVGGCSGRQDVVDDQDVPIRRLGRSGKSIASFHGERTVHIFPPLVVIEPSLFGDRSRRPKQGTAGPANALGPPPRRSPRSHFPPATRGASGRREHT